LADFEGTPFYRALILGSLGYAHADKKDWEKAVTYLTEVAAVPEAPLRDKALFVLAGIHESQGRHDDAQAAYRQIVDEFGDSIYAGVARERVEG
jgi:TolA-binding protein